MSQLPRAGRGGGGAEHTLAQQHWVWGNGPSLRGHRASETPGCSPPPPHSEHSREINHPETRDRPLKNIKQNMWGFEWEFSSQVPMKVNETKCEASGSLESSMCFNDCSQASPKGPRE